MPSIHEGVAGAGPRLKTTRKNLALTTGNETVCSGAPPSGSFVITRKTWPSSLASRDFSGLDVPVTTAATSSRSFIAIVTERTGWGPGNSYCIHALSPTAGIGGFADAAGSPSPILDMTGAPALAVSLGCSDSIGTSAGGLRYATTAASP